MEQTPVHERHNPDLLRLIPADARRIVEAGCSSGALAREYKKINPGCRYVGVEIVPGYAALARRYCDAVHELDIEVIDDPQLVGELATDCWVFGDTLEHLRDPWRLLERIRRRLPSDGCVVACLPNAQHWSVQTRLATGALRYEPTGLLDKTHLRWFTRQTIGELFEQAGFRVIKGFARVFSEPGNPDLLPAIRRLAECAGGDPDAAVRDAMAFQFVLRAVPV